MAISNVSSGLRPGVCTSTTRPTAPFEGQMIYETDTNRVLVWDNSAWVDLPLVTASGTSTVMTATVNNITGQMPFRMAAGTLTATTNTSYQNTFYGVSSSVTFPSGRFTQTPMVVANVAGGGYGWASAFNVSSTGFSYCWLIADGNSATRTINWVAIQMISTSGNG